MNVAPPSTEKAISSEFWAVRSSVALKASVKAVSVVTDVKRGVPARVALRVKLPVRAHVGLEIGAAVVRHVEHEDAAHLRSLCQITDEQIAGKAWEQLASCVSQGWSHKVEGLVLKQADIIACLVV